MNKWIFTILLIFICSLAYARDFGDMPTDKANKIRTKVEDYPTGGILGASDVNVQVALQTLSQHASHVTAILQCETSDNFCFVYEDSILKLYVNNTLQVQWPDVAVFDHILLSDGSSFVVQDDGTSKIRLSL